MPIPFPALLKAARQRQGLTQQEIADALGVSPSAYCGYETGKRQPDLSRLAQLAALLSTSADALLGLPAQEAAPPLAPAEEDVLSRLRALDAHGRRMVRMVLAEEYARMHPAAQEGARLLPFRVSEQPAAAGLGAYLGPEAFRNVSVPADRLPRGASFGVPVCGDSMEPLIHDGDKVLVRLQNTVENGEIAVCIINDEEGTIKKVQRSREGIMLIPLNDRYNHIFIPARSQVNLRIYGKVLHAVTQLG